MRQKLDIRADYKACINERNGYLAEAQRLAELTIPTLEPIPGGSHADSKGNLAAGSWYGGNSGTRLTPSKLRRPKSDAGARALKGWASTIVATNSPANVRWYRLITDPELPVTAAEEKTIAAVFSKVEKRIEAYLQKHAFHAFANSLVKRLGVEGNVGVKVDRTKGLMLYPLRSLAVKRSFGTVTHLYFEEVVPGKDADGNYKPVCQLIYVDKLNNRVYVQREDEESATLTSEKASQYIIVTSDIPLIDNYARSYYSDHYGLLSTIDSEAEALLEAMASASWTPYFFAGSSDIPVARLAALKNREVFRLPPGDPIPVPMSSAQKISDWHFIAAKMTEDVTSLLTLSAVGLQSRAASIQTATEVNAIRAELDSIVGTTSQTISQTFYQPIVAALLDILGIRDEIRDILAAEQGIAIDDSTLQKLVAPIVITGTPALAREQDAERLLLTIERLRNSFPEIVPLLNIPQIAKEILDGLRVNTEGLLLDQPRVDPQALLQATTAAEAEAIGPEQLQQLIRGEQL